MSLTHAWFSADKALRLGSSIFRKPDGSTVNVTRTNVNRDAKGQHPADENYVGEVISSESGGCVRGNQRVRGITG